jgi:hypothetical protein
MPPQPLPDELRRFIVDHVDSVPHLEALLLIRETRRPWTVDEVARRVYLPPDRASRVLEDLVAKSWLVSLAGAFEYNATTTDADPIAQLAQLYPHNLVDIAGLIHRKASTAVLDFARAFQIRKEH